MHDTTPEDDSKLELRYTSDLDEPWPTDFTQRLQWLYDHVPDPRDPARRKFTDLRLAERVAEVTDKAVTPSRVTLWNLRMGRYQDAGWQLVAGIAKAFGKTVLFFTAPNFAEVLEHVREEDAFRTAMQRAGVRNLLLRTVDLADPDLASLTQLVDQVREMLQRHSPPPRD